MYKWEKESRSKYLYRGFKINYTYTLIGRECHYLSTVKLYEHSGDFEPVNFFARGKSYEEAKEEMRSKIDDFLSNRYVKKDMIPVVKKKILVNRE